MSITTEIERLQAARNKLRTKGIELGITNGTAKLDEIAEAFDDIVDQGNVSAEIKEGETYTIPAGYHSGSGTVTGIAGGGNYKLQSKIATPTKKQQSITPDAGNYGLSDVTIQPIPDNFQDVTPVTAGAGDVLATKVIVNALGQTVAGTMPNNGAATIDEIPAGGSATIPAGYHNGQGVAKAKDLASQTPGSASSSSILNGFTAWVDGQKVTGTIPSLVSSDTETNLYAGTSITYGEAFYPQKITVKAVPLATQTRGTAEADKIYYGETAWVDGVKLTGTMPLINAQNGTVKAGGTVEIKEGYHNGKGVITGASLASQTPGDALPRYLLEGATAWVNGEKITGELPEHIFAGGATEKILAAGESYSFDWGVYLNGGTIKAKDLASQTDGDATAGQILSGKIAWVDGVKITGSMTDRGAQALTIDGLTATSVTIPAGYHNGSGTVSLTGDIEAALAAV